MNIWVFGKLTYNSATNIVNKLKTMFNNGVTLKINLRA